MAKYYVGGVPFDSNNCLRHYGIKGQSWGRRRFQNEDGSLTTAGKQRYGIGDFMNSARNKLSSAYGAAKNAYTGQSHKTASDTAYRNAANYRQSASGAYRTASQLVKTYGNDPHGYGSANWAKLSNEQKEAVNDRFNAALARSVEDEHSAKRESAYADKERELYENAPRQKVQKAVDQGKKAVEKIQKNSSSFMSKISEMASSAINAGKSLLKKLFRR